jgi:6-pyruvoyltetrahydropterin/6-carboxytetrahydropterin synthase
MWRLSRTYEIQAAHHLSGVPESHKCSRLHGHTYVVTVTIEGGHLDEKTGFVVGCDFADLDRLVEQLIFVDLDHQYLNTVGGQFATIARGTTEEMARTIYNRLIEPLLPVRLASVAISENSRSRIEYWT